MVIISFSADTVDCCECEWPFSFLDSGLVSVLSRPAPGNWWYLVSWTVAGAVSSAQFPAQPWCEWCSVGTSKPRQYAPSGAYCSSWREVLR